MAKYDSAKYGSGFKYGETSTVSVYYNSGISAWSYDYGTIKLNWNNITADPTEPGPSYWMLVKSYSGFLDNPYDGIKLIGGPYSTFVNSYTDINYDNTNVEVTYSIWVFNGQRWIFCGSDKTILVGDTGTLAKLTSWLPKAWTNTVEGVGEALSYDNNTDFIKSLSAYAFMYDRIRTEGLLLSGVYNKAYTPTKILEKQVTDYGFSYEPSLGDSYHRSLVGAGFVTNTYKGTSIGVGVYTTALTHWGNDVYVGHNLMLDYNDSSFEESVGRWTTSRGTLVSTAYLGSGLTAPSPYIYDRLNVPRAKGFATLTLPGSSPATAATLTLPGTSNSIVDLGIPVVGNTRYIFSGWAKNLNANTATILAAIKWYTLDGQLISTTATPSGITTNSTSWKEFTSVSSSGRNGTLSPANAAFAAVVLTVTPTTTSATTVYLDMLQFAKATDSLEFEDARRVRVYVQGDRENLLPNPDFEAGVGGWLSSSNVAFIQDPTTYATPIYSGTTVSGAMINSGTGGWISSDWFPIIPGENYTFSIYASSQYPAIGRVIPRLEFSTLQSESEQVTVLSDNDGEYYPTTYNYKDGTAVTLTATSRLDGSGNPITDTLQPQGSGSDYYPTTNGYPIQYVPVRSRISVTGIAPVYSKDSGLPVAKVSVYFPDAVAGQSVWFDAAMVQNGVLLQDYFSGNGGSNDQDLATFDPTIYKFFKDEDCIWEYKNLYNLVQNPSFELVTGNTVNNWTVDTVITNANLSRTAGPGSAYTRAINSNGTYANTLTPVTYTPLYGTYMGELSYDTAYGASISTTVYLPSPAIGGEDFVVSAYVRAAEGTYTIGTSGNSNTTSSTTDVLRHDQYQWIRIYNIRQLVAGETSFTLSISIAPPTTYTLGSTSFCHIDGVQAEYGRIPNVFVNPVNTSVTTMANPGYTSANMYVTQLPSTNGGKSSYFSNYKVKYARLSATLGLVMPLGSTYCVKPGFPSLSYPDITESLIPSASFEKDLGSWSGVNSTIKRVLSRGSLFDEFVTHGSAYCLVNTSGTNNATKTFGITTDKLTVVPGQGYYASVALQPANANSTGNYTLDVQFYDANNVVIPVYTDNITGAYTVNSKDASGANNTLATTAARSKVFSITRTDRWAYAANTFSAATTVGASYAILKVTYTPTSYIAGQSFKIDRAIFRQ